MAAASRSECAAASPWMPAIRTGLRHREPLVRREYKNAARRPDAKEGGREEEKNRLGISTERQAPGRPRNMKTGGLCRPRQV